MSKATLADIPNRRFDGTGGEHVAGLDAFKSSSSLVILAFRLTTFALRSWTSRGSFSEATDVFEGGRFPGRVCVEAELVRGFVSGVLAGDFSAAA